MEDNKRPSQGVIDYLGGEWEKRQDERMKNMSFEPTFVTGMGDMNEAIFKFNKIKNVQTIAEASMNPVMAVNFEDGTQITFKGTAAIAEAMNKLNPLCPDCESEITSIDEDGYGVCEKCGWDWALEPLKDIE